MADHYENRRETLELLRTYKRGVIDRGTQQIIMPEEFFNPDGPASLYWEELAEVRERQHDKSMFAYGGFDGLMKGLLDELVSEGKMSRDELQAGDYFFLNVGGIKVDTPVDTPGPCGRELETISYYPRVLADAEAYVANFYADALYPVHVTQVVSLPNKPWEI